VSDCAVVLWRGRGVAVKTNAVFNSKHNVKHELVERVFLEPVQHAGKADSECDKRVTSLVISLEVLSDEELVGGDEEDALVGALSFVDRHAETVSGDDALEAF